jgi:hypothetical protein
MKAKLYEVIVTGSSFEMVHGMKQPLEELYIEEAKLSINVFRGDLNIIDWESFAKKEGWTAEDRYKEAQLLAEDIEVADPVIQSMQEVAFLTETLKEWFKNFEDARKD